MWYNMLANKTKWSIKDMDDKSHDNTTALGKRTECTECGRTVLYNPLDGKCHECSFWYSVAEQYSAGTPFIIVGNECYIMAGEHTSGERGYGGTQFVFELLEDDLRWATTNLWNKGTIPPRFRPLLPENAIMMAGAVNGTGRHVQSSILFWDCECALNYHHIMSDDSCSVCKRERWASLFAFIDELLPEDYDRARDAAVFTLSKGLYRSTDQYRSQYMQVRGAK
jgi:hypothetical protein